MIQQLRDPRAIGLVAFGIVAVLVTWSGIKAVQTNYGLQKQIARLQQQNEVHNLENTNLKLQNEYLNTDQFLELAARREFGKAAPGETVLLVPKSVALAHTVDLDKSTKPKSQPSVSKPSYQRNFEAWIDFFLHRQNTTD